MDSLQVNKLSSGDKYTFKWEEFDKVQITVYLSAFHNAQQIGHLTCFVERTQAL